MGVKYRNPNHAHINGRVSLFKEFNQKGDVAFVGDSITEFSNWDQIFPDKKTVNLGIIGNTTNGVLEITDIIKNAGAKSIFIMVGVNDFAVMNYPVNESIENYKSIINKISTNQNHIFIQSTIKTREVSFNEKIDQLNLSISDFCNSSKKCTWIDINSNMLVDGLLSKDYTTDGIHLNGKGYNAWVEVIKNYI